MGLGSLHVRFDPRDLGLQCFDALLKLTNRQGIEILFRQSDERIIWLAWKEFVQVHGQNR